MEGMESNIREITMRYLEQYIEENLRIKILGKLETKEIISDEEKLVGVEIWIDEYYFGLNIWYVDYAKWLEKKVELLIQKKDENSFI